jgi:hypothetical protein
MHTLRYVAFALLVGCSSPAPDDRTGTDTGTGTDTEIDTGTQECRDGGESCTPENGDFGGGHGDCCNWRHTCFLEGCYYTQP